MNEKEKEYMDYLIHNRTELTNQITHHLDTKKKMEINKRRKWHKVNGVYRHDDDHFSEAEKKVGEQ